MDTNLLIDKLKEKVSPSTILVNCAPDYSSCLVQKVNHRLSYLNKNELYPVINLEMPYPTMSQVWNEIDKEYQQYERYLRDWVRLADKSLSYLFLSSSCLRGRNYSKIQMAIRGEIERYQFGCLYLEASSIFHPDIYVERFHRDKQGGLLFEWENSNNPNWDY